MLDNYSVRFYKNNRRVAPRMLSDIDARLFHTYLKVLFSNYKKRYGGRLSNKSILIVLNGKNIYRRRDRLVGIETVEDMIEYLGISGARFEYIAADNVTLTDMSIRLSDIYVLELRYE